MRIIHTIAASILAGLAVSSHAQTFLLESPVIVETAILTQGAESTTPLPGGGSVTRTRIAKSPFTNREILNAMLERGLITGVSGDWKLVYLQDQQSQGGVYAKKKTADSPSVAPVLVPGDLLSLPAFGPSVNRGTQVTTGGGTFVGNTELAIATCSVRGIATSGLATNGVRTLTFNVEGTTYQVDTVSAAIQLTGGSDDTPSDQLVRGRLLIGKSKLSTTTALP
jgi:hypothetical protein